MKNLLPPSMMPTKASVTMITDSTGSPMKWRNTSRSRSTPSSAPMRIVTTTAAYTGIWTSTNQNGNDVDSTTTRNAPSRANCPCAKFNTPVIL
jgi:hypothetical protein